MEVKYLLPITILCLLLGVWALGWRAKQRHGYGPLYAGLVGSAVIGVGKFAFDSTVATYVGIGVLIVASFWNARPLKKSCACDCTRKE